MSALRAASRRTSRTSGPGTAWTAGCQRKHERADAAPPPAPIAPSTTFSLGGPAPAPRTYRGTIIGDATAAAATEVVAAVLRNRLRVTGDDAWWDMRSSGVGVYSSSPRRA